MRWLLGDDPSRPQTWTLITSRPLGLDSYRMSNYYWWSSVIIHFSDVDRVQSNLRCFASLWPFSDVFYFFKNCTLFLPLFFFQSGCPEVPIFQKERKKLGFILPSFLKSSVIKPFEEGRVGGRDDRNFVRLIVAQLIPYFFFFLVLSLFCFFPDFASFLICWLLFWCLSKD